MRYQYFKFPVNLNCGQPVRAEARCLIFCCMLITVKLLNFWTPENFAVINLKFKQRGQTLGYSAKKIQVAQRATIAHLRTSKYF